LEKKGPLSDLTKRLVLGIVAMILIAVFGALIAMVVRQVPSQTNIFPPALKEAPPHNVNP
jgi:hypothetical protein